MTIVAPVARWTGGLGLSASVIATALGLPQPTFDQRAVIEAPPAPALVIAGAGSGKTETMAGRVVWLVANGHVRRDEVLGLTFTRKAAGELGERIESRLTRMDEYSHRGLLPHLDALAAAGALDDVWRRVVMVPERRRRAKLGEELDRIAEQFGTGSSPAEAARLIAEDALLRSRVTTYNAFADAIVREHAARIGRDAEAALLSQSGSWLTARRAVIQSLDERLAEREDRFGTVVDAVQHLAGELLDNRVAADEVGAFGERFAAAVAPLVNRDLASPGDVEKLHTAMSGLPVLAGLADDYARAKQANNALDFADQVSGALEIVSRAPEVAAELRDQYRVVLLDEYQDTSVIQTQLLAAIFRDAAVMAVGDPHQSIYGWRGASADNLGAFPGAFALTSRCERFALMVSWRNDRAILDAANRLIAGAEAPGIEVPPLEPRPGAGEGRLTHAFETTIEAEAAAVAEWFADVRGAHTTSHAQPHSGAILFRAKRHMSVFADALAERGIPHRILGLGGLLSTPEVVDVVAALRVLSDPSQGSSLIRLLVGPRFAVGVADMAALHELASTLAQRDEAFVRLPDHVLQRLRGSVGIDEQVSIVDALDVVRALPADYRLLSEFTEEGIHRLKAAGAVLERLRSAVAQPVPELIRTIELELGLDIELSANESRGPARLAGTQLRSFVDEIRTFLAADERGSIGSLLAWLDHAEDTDELMPRPEPPEPGVVQLLTIHGAKGLEWDAVAVVRLVQDELPKRSRSTLGWLGFGVLPYVFRGDRAALPSLAWDPGEPTDRRGLQGAITAFKAESKAFQEREERRLAYVAVTRARSDLMLSGSRWGGQKEARKPSAYLEEIISAAQLDPIEVDESDENPYEGRLGATLQWPLDPLGARGDRVRAAAAMAEAALATEQRADPSEQLKRLLLERAARGRAIEHDAPPRVAASRFKDFVDDFAGTVRSIGRPVPERPYDQTRRGTLFHAWVEQRSGMAGRGTSLDDGLWEIDEERVDTEASRADAAELERLIATFLASEWAHLRPIEVETEIDVRLAGAEGLGTVVCKLDAVYRRGDRIEIVDWKTGRPPRSQAERDERLFQLALYRVAYHKRHGVPLENLDVVLYYVSDDLVIRSDRVYSESELAQRWNAARDARSASRSSSASEV